MAESMAIKREIIYELAKEIPPTKIPDVIDKLWDKTIGFRMGDMRRRRYKARKIKEEDENGSLG